jgi:hypothetical protein
MKTLNNIEAFSALVQTIPAELLVIEYRPESFGSWYIEFRAKGSRYRFAFDGGDQRLSLELGSNPKPQFNLGKTCGMHRRLPTGKMLPFQSLSNCWSEKRRGFSIAKISL